MIKENLFKFWNFLKEDSWQSMVVFLLIAIIFIRFLFFPALSFVTGTSLPLVIVESCSMYHSQKGFEQIFEKPFYGEKGISIEDTVDWDFQNGLNKGDVIFVVRAKNLEVGDVVIFEGGERYPIIHRLVRNSEPYQTMGDNNYGQLKPPRSLTDETNISEDQLVGKAVFRVPYLGWIKLIFFEFSRPESQRGFC